MPVVVGIHYALTCWRKGGRYVFRADRGGQGGRQGRKEEGRDESRNWKAGREACTETGSGSEWVSE